MLLSGLVWFLTHNVIQLTICQFYFRYNEIACVAISKHSASSMTNVASAFFSANYRTALHSIIFKERLTQVFKKKCFLLDLMSYNIDKFDCKVIAGEPLQGSILFCILVYLSGNNVSEGENNIKYASSYPMN